MAASALKQQISGMVGFTTVLTRWVDSSWFSVISVVCIVCVGFAVNLVVGVGVYLATYNVDVVTGSICVVLGLVFRLG